MKILLIKKIVKIAIFKNGWNFLLVFQKFQGYNKSY